MIAAPSPASSRHARVFVIELSRDADPGEGNLAGRLEHVDSGRYVRFTSTGEMNEFFARILRELEDPNREGGSEGPVANQSRRAE